MKNWAKPIFLLLQPQKKYKTALINLEGVEKIFLTGTQQIYSKIQYTNRGLIVDLPRSGQWGEAA